MAYTDKERTNIIAQYKQGSSAKDLSTKYGVCERTIYRWAKVYNELHPDKKRTFTVKEYERLFRRVEKLENIISVLKAVDCTVHAPLKEKLHELELLYGQYDVYTLVRLWMFLGAPFITISSAINVATHGLRDAGRSTVF